MTTAASSGFTGVNLARLLTHREENEKQVDRSLILLKDSLRSRMSLQLMQMLARGLIFGMLVLLVWQLTDRNPEPLSLAGLLLLVALVLGWLEWLVSEQIARSAEQWLLRMSGFIRGISLLLYPLASVPMTVVSEANGELETTTRVTEAELKTLVDAGQQEGVLEKEERKMIYSVIALGDTLAREIMVPRIDVLALDVDTPLHKAVDALLKSGYSRIPVYEETIDHILGLLYAKDLLDAWRTDSQNTKIRKILRPAYFVPEAKKLDELLAEMQSRRVHMAIVVDEYGGVAGLVTLEDIVEEIVGEIRDEYDHSEEAFYQQVTAGEYVFSGRIPLDDFNELMDSNLPDDDADTLGGYIYSQIGRVPIGGESVQVENLLLTVEQVSKRRIRKIHAKYLPPSPQDGHEEVHAKQ